MNAIAIIPARGGSKRLPRKNILPLNGIPLLEHVLNTCKESSCFKQIIVSTEDDEIADIAINCGVVLHRRPAKLSTDQAGVNDVCLDVLETYNCDLFCCVYATAALLKARTIKKSYEKFKSLTNSSTLLGVSHYNNAPVQALEMLPSGHARLLMPEYASIKSQMHPVTRVSNGTFCWADTKSFKNCRSFYAKDLSVFDVPDDEVCDIDEPSDYEALLEIYNKR